MTLKRQAGIRFAHSLAVVYHLHTSFPGIGHHHLHTSGSGINGVLHQFLDEGSGALNDFAGSNLIGH